MKKFLIGALIVIAVCAIVGVGCIGLGAHAVNETVNTMQAETEQKEKLIQDMTKDMKCEIKSGDFNKKIISTFDNTSDKTIDYIQFNYKLYKDGTVIESSFTNATDVKPGEKRQIEILPIKGDFDKYEITASGHVS